MRTELPARTSHPRPAGRFGLVVAAFSLIAVACGGASTSESLGTTSVSTSPSAAAPRGSSAAQSSFVLFDGSEATLATFGGEPLVVNFWASWCPSCVAEMAAAFKPVEEQLGSEVTFLGMNIQDERHLALDLLAETGVQWISAEDPTGALYLELGGIGMPFTVFVSAGGEVVDTHNGPLNESQLRDRIKGLFGV